MNKEVNIIKTANIKKTVSYLGFFIFLSFINVSTAKADYKNGPAYRVCASHQSRSFSNKCLKIIKGFQFDVNALIVCDQQHEYSKPLNDCILIVRGHRFDANATKVCNRHTKSHLARNCLKIVRGYLFNEEALKACDRYRQDSHVNKCLKLTKGQIL